jgi:hypothetical protein
MGMIQPKKRPSERRFSWFMHLGTCYKRGYEAQKAGEPFDGPVTPYRNGSGVQQQRRGAWERGYKRAESGLPMDDSNG